ncbi:SusC/RagA family TonB-linked outer membrane protein [Bacteroides sp.]
MIAKSYKTTRSGILLLLLILTSTAFAQERIIKGKVADQNKEPLIGVSVAIKNSTQGTITDMDGMYSIQVPNENAVLSFSYIGYQPKDIRVGERQIINVTMEEESILMDQVVVIGYGNQKKVNLTGAVSSVSVDKALSSRSIANVSSALQGLMPGLSVSQTSGMAGNNSAKLLIRGLGTINNADPLIVVDDMPDADINRLNMNDIESITVLKDATASSVYGSRAANGVILIKTKSGKGANKTQITFSGSYGWEKATKAYDLLSDYPRALTLHQISNATNPGKNGDNQIFKDGTIDEWMAMSMIDEKRFPNTDWWDYVMRTGSLQNYNVSATGGNESSNFYASIGYMKQNGLQINNDFDRYNARFNFDYKLMKNMNTGFRFDGNWSDFTYALSDGFTGDGNLDMATAVAGIYPYDPELDVYGGVMAYGEDPSAFNPVSYFNTQLKHRDRQELNSSIYLDWEPIKGLVVRADYGLKYYNEFNKEAPIPNRAYNFQTESFGSRYYVTDAAGVRDNTKTGYKTLLNARLNYHTKIADHHDLSAMFVYSEEYWHDRSQTSYRADRIHPSLEEIDAALTTTQSTGGNSSAEGLRSYIGRVNYNAYDRYLLELNFRVDGSSKFQPGHRYGFFPSAAVGWRFSEEQFIKKYTENWLSNGKFRVSYGELGNNSGIGRYQQKEILYQNNYMLNGAIANGFVYSKMLNPDLTWESTSVFNIGLDLIFFNGRLSTEFDYYDRLTTGMLQKSQMSIHLTGAYEAPMANLGNLRNRGFEANLTWRDQIADFNYSANFNISYNRSNLEKWGEFLDKGYVFIDMPYHFVYYQPDKGLAQTYQDSYNSTPQGVAPGDVIRTDTNGDGRIDGNDKIAMTNAQVDMPTTTLALNLQASWKGIDVSMLFQGAIGRKDFWTNKYTEVNLPDKRYSSTQDHIDKPWSWENRNGEWPRLGGLVTNKTGSSEFWLRGMDYLRMKNLMVGYTFPKKWVNKFFAENLRVYVTLENLFTITNYEGLDPEKGASSQDLYPTTKSYSLGINLSF